MLMDKTANVPNAQTTVAGSASATAAASRIN